MAAARNHRIMPLLLLAVSVLLSQLAPAAACPSCGGGGGPSPKPPTPSPPPPSPPPPKMKPPPTPTTPCPPPPAKPSPSPPYTPAPSPTGKCPINVLKLVACVDALNGLVHAVVGSQATEACCPLLSGVADIDAALCLCTTIKAKALNISLVLPIALEVLVNQCGKHVPASFQCPS